MNSYPVAIRFADFNDPPPVLARRSSVDVPVTRSARELSIGSTVSDQRCGAVEIKLRSVTTGRASAQVYKTSDPPHGDIASGDGARFCFAPGAEAEEVWIHWRHTGEAFIAESRLELYYLLAGARRLVWRKVFRWDHCPADAKTRFNGDLAFLDAGEDVAQNPGLREVELEAAGDLARFPADHVTIERSPYELKLTVVPRPGLVTVTSASAWTYFDVRPQAITLSWCPDADLDNVLPGTRKAQHLAVCRSLADAHDAHNLNGALPQPGQAKKVYLKSNVFYRTNAELANITYYERYRALWGDGPVIPVLATIAARRSDGTAVDAPRGVGEVRLMWEWVDQGARPWPVADANDLAWMNDARDYKAAVTAESPAGRNCHVERGGKRGVGARTCFPQQNGKPPAGVLPAHDGSDQMFPFRVDPLNAGGSPFASRKWAAYSRAWGAGCLAGKSGVLFQPSRMIGDGYDLRVYLAYDTDHEMETSAAPGTVPAELRAETGTFEIWRELDVIKHWRMTVTTPPGASLDVAGVAAKFERYYVRINVPVVPADTNLAPWWAALQHVAAAPPAGAPHIWDAIDPTQHAQHLIHFFDYPVWHQRMLAAHGGNAAALGVWANAMVNGFDALGNPRPYFWERLDGGNGLTPVRNPWPVSFDPNGVLALDGTVRVEFPGLPGAGIPLLDTLFDRAGRMTRDRVTALSGPQRAALKVRVGNALRAHAQGNCGENNMVGYQRGQNSAGHTPFRVKVSATTGNPRRLARLNHVRQAVVEMMDELVYDEGLSSYDGTQTRYGWGFFVFDAVMDHLMNNVLAGQEGIVVVQVTDLSNKGAPAGKAFYANAAGTRAVAATLAANPALVTLEHEIGHALFLNHTWHSQESSDPNRLHQLAPPSSGSGTTCVMHYQPSANCQAGNVYCGFCVARLWGWSFVAIDPATNQPAAPATRVLYADPAYNKHPGAPALPAPDPQAPANPHPPIT